jgi:ABC-type glycerol-3-phosphate transport system permease component
MSTSKRIRLTPGQLMVHLGLLLLVILWILPTVGLLVSSFRDKDQLAATGWWTALSTSVQNRQGRTGTSEQMVETGGKFVIAGNLLDDSKRTILTFNTNFRDLAPSRTRVRFVLRQMVHIAGNLSNPLKKSVANASSLSLNHPRPSHWIITSKYLPQRALGNHF